VSDEELDLGKLRRMTDSDWMAFQGAEELPSGRPLIGSAVLPFPEHNEGDDMEVLVIVCGDEDQEKFFVAVFYDAPADNYPAQGITYDKGDQVELMYWLNTCEKEAIGFANTILNRVFSIQTLEQLKIGFRG
jgi:hypothetical protein